MKEWIPFLFLFWNLIGYTGQAISTAYFKGPSWKAWVVVWICYAISILGLIFAEKGGR